MSAVSVCGANCQHSYQKSQWTANRVFNKYSLVYSFGVNFELLGVFRAWPSQKLDMRTNRRIPKFYPIVSYSANNCSRVNMKISRFRAFEVKVLRPEDLDNISLRTVVWFLKELEILSEL